MDIQTQLLAGVGMLCVWLLGFWLGWHAAMARVRRRAPVQSTHYPGNIILRPYAASEREVRAHWIAYDDPWDEDGAGYAHE